MPTLRAREIDVPYILLPAVLAPPDSHCNTLLQIKGAREVGFDLLSLISLLKNPSRLLCGSHELPRVIWMGRVCVVRALVWLFFLSFTALHKLKS